MSKFIASTDIGISIKAGDKYRFISFDLSSNGSSYSTDNPAIIAGLRKHKGYGKLFTEIKEENTPTPIVKSAPQPEVENQIIHVASLQDAKDYLVERYGISRTQLTSKVKILAQAKNNNIEFDGI